MDEHRGHQIGRGSPFPGMDPYLEGELWQEFHDTFAHQIRGQLLPLLPPKYVALLSKRYIVDRTGLGIFGLPLPRVIYPDVHVVRPSAVKETAALPYTVVTPPAVELVNLFPLEVPLLSVEIRDVAERRLVTVIEILSPVNKRGDGFREYVERRTELLQTLRQAQGGPQTHLLEIDLLRLVLSPVEVDGRRLQLTGGELPPASHYVFLSRFTRRPISEACTEPCRSIWTIGLREPLPTVPVPLLPPDPDVPLQLQAAVEACFGLVGYERLLDYTQPPPPPALDAEDLAWARARVEAVSGIQKSNWIQHVGARRPLLMPAKSAYAFVAGFLVHGAKRHERRTDPRVPGGRRRG